MSVKDAFESVNKGLNHYAQFNGNAQVSVSMCIIRKIYPVTLRADIFIPKTSTSLYNVSISFPYSNSTSGIIIMPKENSPALVVITSDSKPFIITSINTSNTNESPSGVLENENLIYSMAGSFLKQDNLGSQIITSGSSSSMILDENNSIKLYSPEQTNKTLISKSISGSTNILTDNGLKTLEFQKFYGSITVPRTYNKTDLQIQGTDGLTIDSLIKESIVSNALNTINMAQNLFIDIESFKSDIMSNPYITKEQIQEKVSLTKAKLYNNYSIKKNTILTIEKGIAINRDINSLDELSDLTIGDIEVSERSNNIVFRAKVLDEQSGNNVAIISIDSKGYIVLQCKDFKTKPL